MKETNLDPSPRMTPLLQSNKNVLHAVLPEISELNLCLITASTSPWITGTNPPLVSYEQKFSSH